jgi:predicted nucleic acid-binding protein
VERLPGLGCQAEGQLVEVGLIRRAAVKAALQYDNRRRAQEEAAREGRYVLTTDVAREMGRLAQRLKNEFDNRQQAVVRALFAANASATAAGKVLKERDFLHIAAAASKSWGTSASASTTTAATTIPEQIFHEDFAVADAEADE